MLQPGAEPLLHPPATEKAKKIETFWHLVEAVQPWVETELRDEREYLLQMMADVGSIAEAQIVRQPFAIPDLIVDLVVSSASLYARVGGKPTLLWGKWSDLAWKWSDLASGPKPDSTLEESILSLQGRLTELVNCASEFLRGPMPQLEDLRNPLYDFLCKAFLISEALQADTVARIQEVVDNLYSNKAEGGVA